MTNEDYIRLRTLWTEGRRDEVVRELLTLPRSDVAQFIASMADERPLLNTNALVARMRHAEKTDGNGKGGT